MFRIRSYFFLLFCTGFFTNVKATHNRAGEITYKWISGFTYQIKVTTYTNIGGTNLADRCEDTVYFGDGTKAVVLRSNGSCTGSCNPMGCEGQPLPGNTIKLNEYVTTHTYPGPGNYKLSMEDPNRNAGIINIPNSVNQVFYIESFLVIPAFGSTKNNSPILTFPPIDNACVGNCFYHNPGAYDIDGDSLSYELMACKGHLGVTCPGYTYPNSGPGGVFQIDPLTGTLAWCKPQIQGEYNMAILIKEWRRDNNGNYFLVGFVERDLQVNVGTCNNTLPEILFSNLDTCVLAGTTVSKTINAGDPDNDFISLSANGGAFAATSNPAVFSSISAISVTSGIFNWNTNNIHVRRMPYQVTLKVKDNDPGISLVHFKTFMVKVIPQGPMNLSTLPSGNNIFLSWNKPAAYELTGPNPFLRYKIYRKNGLSNWNHANNEMTPPAYTGFTFLGSSTGGITDTTFYDYNSGNPFITGQDYSYLVLAEYTDGACSYVSNIAADQIFVGIQEQSLSSADVQVYPNPVDEDLMLIFKLNSSEKFSIELMDVTGRSIIAFITQENITQQDVIHLNLDGITRGIYFLRMTGNQHTSITKKIVKQ